MQARGYTLVEIIVVICIVSLLLAIGTLKFGESFKRYRTEAQTRMIYTELLQARANALYQRRETRVKFSRESFEVYSSVSDGSGVAPVMKQALRYPVMVNSNQDPDGVNVDFDEKGMAVLPLRSICINASDSVGSVDSVVIANLRVRIGKKDEGGTCDGENITTR
jgi:prepilin-type N-terminal cleavage/methylation domain-containing protein